MVNHDGRDLCWANTGVQYVLSLPAVDRLLSRPPRPPRERPELRGVYLELQRLRAQLKTRQPLGMKKQHEPQASLAAPEGAGRG